MKQKPKNNKGFTLIELLITIVILVMLSVLATPNVIKLIDKNNRDNYNNTINSVISSAKIYVTTNKYTIFDEKNSNGDIISCNLEGYNNLEKFINLNELDINKEIVNSCTKENIDKDNCGVVVNYDCIKKTYTYKVDCNNDAKSTESFKIDNSNIYTDEIGRINDEYYCDDLF